MDTNISGWKYYQPGYIHEEFVPYMRDIIQDPWGHYISINTWKQNGCPLEVDPRLVRINRSLAFQKMFDTDPCPNGFMSMPGPRGKDGYCMREPLKGEPVFYTNKAFIAKHQYWDGYTNGTPSDMELQNRPSEPTDLRSVNPFTGMYTIYYPGKERDAPIRYARPLVDERIQYDHNWSLPERKGYASLPTTDSYL